MKSTLGSRVFDTFNYLFLAFVSLSTLLPFLYVIIVSFTDPTEYATRPFVLFPYKWSLASYQFILSTPTFLNSLSISAFLAIIGTACSLLITSGLSYALSRKKFRLKRQVLMAILFTMLFNPGMIPNYLLIKQMGLINTVWALILPVLTSAWYVILMKSFYQEIPDELEESAKIDGCTDIGVFFRVMLPVSLSAIAAFSLFFAVAYWNTYFSAVLYINKDVLRPMQVVLQVLLIQASTQVGDPAVAQMLQSDQMLPKETIKMSAVVVASLPIIIVYPFLQRYFVKGMMVGSVKG
ncbi:carbohydrate ABC transporter permease [Paenibacillus cremeus]|uniref:Carbohydrate ABC transporter permease n=1 Tax=Paenibacillus cremeus TaxID=2163881 RepID=A0A559K620_9BACL|nr:carbohydrate ABC transporter permease [Paenibacillus cremeus]